MIQKYIIDKTDLHDLLTGKEIPLPQGNKARAFCVEIPDGMTNGEVIQALFPNLSFNVILSKMYASCGQGLLDWWNAPYKAERGE